jgi:predicted naringenin-chalcone synthase
MSAYINQIACAVPPTNAQPAFLESLPDWAGPPDVVEKLRKIAAGSRIESRFTVLGQPFGQTGFYKPGAFPSTAERMLAYQREAPRLAVDAVDALRKNGARLDRVTHLIVTSCTGFYAPGLDIDILREAGLAPSVQRTLIGFMGCHAGLIGLRNARHIVEADPEAVVLMVNLELCTLHLQQTDRIDRLVSFLLFADGAAASVISSNPKGLRLEESSSHLSLADGGRMAWHIEDQGFAMTLDARLPARIREWFRQDADLSPLRHAPSDALWAVHPGGRLILDGIQETCGLSDEQLAPSRHVLRRFGNLSSASIMFILRDLMAAAPHHGPPRAGRAVAFGPGLAVETIAFSLLPRPSPAPPQPNGNSRRQTAVWLGPGHHQPATSDAPPVPHGTATTSRAPR